MSSNSTGKREHTMQFYNQLYIEKFRLQPKLDVLSFDSIGIDEDSWLERAVEESEVFEVVRVLNGDKAPNPDGFSMVFSQTCWEVIKEDIIEAY
jgi:hypothetical protein